MILFWVLVFIVSLAVLLKGSDWLLNAAEKLGLVLGLSPFIIGVTIISIGTSFPELISSLFAVLKQAPEIVTANAVGSNIANTFLILGLAAILGKGLRVTKDLIDLDLPLLALSTVLFLGVAVDGKITFIEALLLLIGYGVYFAYNILQKDISAPKKKRGSFQTSDIVFLILGIAGVALGARFLIDSVLALSGLLGIATGVISILAIAIGTSLPELFVSVKAAMQKKPEIALGNVFGSNVFNILVVVGLPGIFGVLPIAPSTLAIGLPVLAVATLLFIVSGISKRIHAWEGFFYLLLYVLFSAKVLDLF